MKLSSNVVSVLSLISGHVDMPEMSSLPDVCLARDLAVECLFRVFFVGDVVLASNFWPEISNKSSLLYVCQSFSQFPGCLLSISYMCIRVVNLKKSHKDRSR